MDGLGVEEEADRRIGTWSEVERENDRNSESESDAFHLVLTSALSRRARVGGFDCLSRCTSDREGGSQ